MLTKEIISGFNFLSQAGFLVMGLSRANLTLPIHPAEDT
jgi:hypothetical protein